MEIRKLYILGRLLSIILVLPVIMLACSNDGSEDKISSNNLITTEFIEQYHEETSLIDFRKGGNAQEFLVSGWYYQEDNQIWTRPPCSSIRFFSYDTKNNKKVTLECVPVRLEKGEEQAISVYLNGTLIETIHFGAESWQQWEKYSFTLPSTHLESGLNSLVFSFSSSSKPGVRDARELAVAFQTLDFSDNHALDINDNALCQEPNTIISSWAHLPKDFTLFVRYRAPRKAITKLQFADAREILQTFNLVEGEQELKVPVRLKESGYYKLSLIAEGKDADGPVTWKSVKVYDSSASNVSSLSKVDKMVSQEPMRPDIIFYVVDTLRADHLGCYEYKRNTSPNIDSFAGEGLLHSNAFANASWTRPSAATILTGLYAKNHKTMTRDSKLPSNIITLGQILKNEGYYTIAVVTNLNLSQVFGFDKGFDEFHELGEDYNSPHVHRRAIEINTLFFSSIDAHLHGNKKPVFALLWASDPHDPYVPPKAYSNLFNISNFEPIDINQNLLSNLLKDTIQASNSQLEYIVARYDQEIASVDDAFEELLEGLRQRNMYNEALIIFTSDHGEEFLDHRGWGHGLTLYNELLKVPLIIKWKKFGAGINHHMVQHADLFPTVTDIIGAVNPYHLDGLSLREISNTKRTLYCEEQHDGNCLYAALDGKIKIIYTESFNNESSRITHPAHSDHNVIEVYGFPDIDERDNIYSTQNSPYLQYLKQRLLVYANRYHRTEIEKIDIPKEIDEKLKALGYVR